MRRALVIAATLAIVAAAQAEYRIWFTAAYETMGLTNPNLIDNPSTAITSDDDVPDYSNNTDVYSGDYVLAGAPCYMTGEYNMQDCNNPEIGDEWFYIWGQFYGEDTGALLSSATLNVVDCYGASATCVEVFWYKVDNMASPLGVKRWDGASTEADNYSTFRNLNQDLVAAYGIKNQGGTGGNWNLYTGGPQDGDCGRVSLLGALRLTDACPGGVCTIDVPLDGNGDPLFVIDGVPTMPIVGAFICPEPASLLLMGLAGLLLRRR
ncbi:MAG: PEP-CTERM sorting domain-containing protein [Phycisphaerae bacterium]|nr:PEP-CTERM sorting domain-containing protein [Phycisphaerae bacterium]